MSFPPCSRYDHVCPVAALVLFCLTASLWGVASASPNDAPVRRALLFCNDIGLDRHNELDHACSDTKRIASALVDLGWVARDEVHVEEGISAEQILDEASFMAKSWPDPINTVFVYVQGHGHTDGFRMGGSTLKPMELVDKLEVLLPHTDLIFMFNKCRGNLMADLAPEFHEPDLGRRSHNSTIIYSSARGFVSYERLDIGASIFAAALLHCMNKGPEGGAGGFF